MASRPRMVGFAAIVSMVSLVAGQQHAYARLPVEARASVNSRLRLENGTAVAATPPHRPGPAPSGTQPSLPAAAGVVCSSLFYPLDTPARGMRGEAVAIGDVNDDGRNDVVMTTYSGDASSTSPDSMKVFLQNMVGGLLPPATYAVGNRPASVAIGDVNGDGRQDVVVGNASPRSSADSIGVLLQNSAGGLDPMQTLTTGRSEAVRIADVNNDGRLDVVGAGTELGYLGGVDVFLQQANGTLEARVSHPLALFPTDLDVGDVNGDGLTDVVAMTNGNVADPSFAVLPQQTGGDLGTPVYYDMGGSLTNGVAVGDATGDGLNDVVVTLSTFGPSDNVLVFRQTTTGALDTPAAAFPSLFAPLAVEMADMDLDGRIDVVVTHPGVYLGVYLQKPDGALGDEVRLHLRDSGNVTAHGLAVGDINGDGHNDAVFADDTDGLVVLRRLPPNTAQVAACVTGDTALPGQPVNVTAWNGPGGRQDWVGLHAVGAPDTSFLSWKYLNDSTTIPVTGLAEGTLGFVMPQTEGSYNFRFFANNGYQKLATSQPLTVGTPPQIWVTPSFVSFGSVALGTPVDRDVTITNIGAGTLVGSATVNSAGFTLLGDSSYSLVANQSKVLSVRFAPPSAIHFEGVMALTGGNGTTVGLGGTGLGPDSPVLQVLPTSVSFGTVAVGSSADRQVTVTNVGTGTLVGSVAASGLGFGLIGNANYSLTANQSAVLTVRFMPTSPVPFNGTLNLTGGLGATVPLAGSGSGPGVFVSVTLVNPGQVIQVTASGGPRNPKDWVGLHTAAGPDSSYLDWKYLNGLKTAPATGLNSASLNFTMPQTPGTYNFRFFANNTFQKLATSATVTVRDTPFLEVSPTNVTFGSVAVGSFADRQVTVKNAGAGTASGSGTVTGTGYSLVGNAAYSLTHNQTALLTVRFTPAFAGAHPGTLTLTGGGGATVPLTGGGLQTTLSVNATTVNPGGAVQVTVAKGPGNPRDWVGLARVGDPDTTYLAWYYLNGLKTPPAQGMTSAVLTFTMPTSPGTYEFRFFRNNTFQRLATSPVVTVPGGPIIQVTPTNVSFGSVNVGSFADRPVTVKNVGTQALSGSATVSGPPFSMVGNATYSLAPNQSMALMVRLAPQQAGHNEGILTLTGGAGAVVAIHGTGTVGTGPTLAVSSTLVAPGATVQVTVAGGPGNQRDWVGLYTTAAGDMGYLDWKYLSGLRTLPPTGLTGAVLTFTMPQTPGTYNLRFFANGTYQKLATSVAVTVQ